MSSWRDEILRNFGPGGSRLTVVHDPDCLLTEERVLNVILDNGYEVLLYEDPIAFRYAYEANYRSAWDAGEDKKLLVLVQDGQEVDSLPYDILSGASVFSFALHDIFPGLSYPVICALDRSLFDALWEACQHHDGGTLGDHSTKEFVLTHCHGVVPALVKSPGELMRYLLDRHYRGERYPEILDEFILEQLHRQPALSDYPLDQIVPHRQSFLSFLQDQWRDYVSALAGGDGKCIVPFEHHEVRIYLDNLFIEGLLQPVDMPGEIGALPDWARFGIVIDAQQDARLRFDQLLLRTEEELPDDGASYRDWQSFSTLWAETVIVRWRLKGELPEEQSKSWKCLHNKVEIRFADWMLKHFGALPSLSPHPVPVMAHMIPRYLSAMRSRGDADKIALLVLDGMAMDQWFILQEQLESDRPQLKYDVTPVFAWVPTSTSVCRQAIFAGQPPLSFPDSILQTSRDERQWIKFWDEQAAHSGKVIYWLGHVRKALPWLDDLLDDANVRTMGMVFADVDDMAHGATLGTQDLHQSMMVWAERGQLAEVIARLDDSGFQVFITSDHGNVEAAGMGTPREGALVDSAGTRARFYRSKQLRAAVHKEFPDTREWPGVGLPPGNELLLPHGLSAFTTAGKIVVTHGGISLEETIVPFIRVIAGASDGS